MSLGEAASEAAATVEVPEETLGLKAAAARLLKAVHSNDVEAVEDALRMAHCCLDDADTDGGS